MYVFPNVAPFAVRLVVEALVAVKLPIKPLVNERPDPERLDVDAYSAKKFVVDAVTAASNVAVAFVAVKLVVDARPNAARVAVALVMTALVAKRLVIVEVPKVEVPAVKVEKSP